MVPAAESTSAVGRSGPENLHRWAGLLCLCGALASWPARSAAAPGEPTASRRGDLELARSAYVDQSRAFSATERRRAERFIERAMPRVEAMTPAEFLLCVLQIPAFADNAHDVVNTADDAWWPSTRLPLRMIWFPDGWVIARASPEQSDLLGARVLKIEGLRPAAMLARLRRLWGGPDSSRRWNLEWIIETGGMLHARGLARRPNALEFQVRLRDDRRLTRSIDFVASESVPAGQGPVRLWSPDPWPGEADKGWRSEPEGSAPLYLQEGARRFRLAALPDLDAVYVQFRGHFDAPDEKIVDFTRSVDAMISAQRPRNLIVDLRFDIGGNTDLTRSWLRQLAETMPGRIYVLVGPFTFSAGIVAAAALKHDGVEKVQIVGEEVGDRLQWWSEGKDVCLPASHYCLHATTGLWDLARGCGSRDGCYGDKYSAVVGSLRPDHYAPLRIDAWLAGRDPGLIAIERDLATRPTHPTR
jgi:hypothetical protein